MMCGQPAMTILDPQTFAASTLADSEGRTAALKMLASCLAGPDIPLDLIVQDLCSVPNLFETIVSALPSAEKLLHRILDTYPTDPALVDASSAGILLRRLSSIMFALPPDLFSTDIFRRIGRYKVYVEDVFPVLSLLLSTEFSTCITTDATPTSPLEDPEYNDEEFSGFLVRNKKQKKPKRKIKNNAPAIDMAPFHKLGSKVPLSNAEASQMARDITDDLKMILKFYLELLPEPSLAQHLMNAYVSTCDDEGVHPSAPQETQVPEVVGQRPSAYPKVQPMKAALYFENADGFGEWRIIIGTDATRKLRELATGDRKKCAIVVKKIKQLSNGHFSDENQKRLNGSSEVPIFEAKMQRDLRLVYQVDVVPDHDGKVERQVIKIYGIYTHTQLNRIWDAMGHHLAGKGKEYRRRCIFRNPPAHPDVYFPACFPPEELQNATKPVPLVLSDEDMGELHSLLVLHKYVTFSQAFLHSLIANQDVQHVFELTQHERRIVECNTSCYVLGRSGTGKTTTMLFKMLGIQRAWEMEPSGMLKPRQIFVTKSRVLATKVEEYFVKLLGSLALAGCSLQDLKRMQTRTTESGIDRMVAPEDQKRADIPQRYSALEGNHFPLFVTFDELAKMIAADVLIGDDPEAQYLAKYFINTDEVRAQDSFVTYDVFARTYWPHFPQQLTRGLEPWLVFSEFMGIIKGSEKSLSCPGGFLDEEAYCSLPARSNPTFANQRPTVYATFEAYCRLKKERRHHDVADRTHAILKTLLGGTPLKGQRVDFLYIDEAQDNLLIDALLLRLICWNPEGLFWAGDTAQTISAGSSFRFDDLKAFLYRIEQDQSTYLIQDRSVTDPTAFQLAINYRSHGGIVNCAHTIIERITHFWPDAIDTLQPEHGIVDGLKPVFFRGWDQDTVRYEQFLFGESGSRIEFGAEQCILVRDNEALQKFQKEVGEIGSIMTLYDSKGLEFNDVLLYNFFEDSAVDISRWRVLLNHMEGEVEDGQALAKVHAPSFSRDEGRFAGVCSELKLLYVGITRARKNLWIFDKSDKSEPMRMIWTSRNQVQNCTPGTDVPHLAVSSTPEEWESFGHDLFNHGRYPQATHCFARASLPRMVAICEAHHLRELARAKVGVAPPKAQQDAFLTAADAFVASAEDAPPGNAKLQYYRNAAECYVRAGDDRKAADAYLDAKEYDLAARRYRKVGLFDKTLEILHKHSQKMESSEGLYTVCRLFYCSKDVDRPRLPLFPSFEEELGFLEDYDLDSARRATLLENHGRYMEAAELHLSENRPLDAIGDLLRDKGSHDAIQQAAKIILDGLWRRCSFGIPSQEVAADLDVVKLLKLANELPVEFVDPLDHDEISIFRAIAHADLPTLEKLSHVFMEKRKATALLALDHFFSSLPALKSYKLQEVSLFLEKFRKYTRLLYQIISNADPLGTDRIKQLFCIREVSDTEYGLELGSFLHSSATSDPNGPMYLQPSVVALSKRQVVTALRKYVANHLRERVNEENDLCYEAVVFSPCLTHIITKQCNRDDCPLDHVVLADLDAKYYNTRISIHLQQMCILQCMYSANQCLVRRITVVDWLVHLYEALNPEFHIEGSTADLDPSMISAANEGIAVMKHWVWEALHLLSAHHKGFFTTVLKLTSLLFVFDKSSALNCINRAQFVAHDIRPREFVYSDGYDGVEDLLNFFDGTKQTSISAGMKFLRHVLKTGLTMNLSVFCDYLEDIIGKILVSWRLSYYYDPPLDGLVLPRGWLSSNKNFSKKQEVRIPLLLDLLGCVRDLLLFLQSGSANERYMLSHSKLTPMLCNVFTSRICRVLCLLVHNVRNLEVIHCVRNTLNALQTAGPMQKAHFLYRKYTLAEPSDYLKVIVNYDAGVVIQDLVQLLHKRRVGRPVRLLRLTHIYYENPLDIPSLVAPQLVKARSNLRADAPTFTPRGVHTSHVEVAEEPAVEEPLPEEHEVKPVDEVEKEPQDFPPATNEPALIRAHEFTVAETAAVATIQAAYRAYYKRREAQARAIGRGLTAQRNAIFIECWRNVCAFNWKKTPYRTLYLWALPRLIVCLDKAISTAHEFKRKIKGLLLKADHERLEELGKKTSLINVLVKDGHDLRKKIEPGATMHQAKDENAMKQAVSNVNDLIRRLPISTLAPELLEDFQIAHDLVMVEKQPVSKPEKPTLNTEDL
ncbi:hypothetical protein L210DRAFT_3480852 [Boletus edulis BED1]|uniref:UvrD-like helicase ATP-binding domain-containing protein n=1 Tax=Boletus edulis BED1 TaxID=1328754 RepID=A0AAD4GFA0_BOLED|nr:hypothetical protein L210DRAFT_3480852 [Boletus edulis BED1]